MYSRKVAGTDLLDASDQVVDVPEQGNVLPAVAAPEERRGGGEVGEVAEGAPPLRLPPVHRHRHLSNEVTDFSLGVQKQQFSANSVHSRKCQETCDGKF